MGLIRGKSYRRVPMYMLIALVVGAVLIFWRTEQRNDHRTTGYEKVAELPAPFVLSTQKAAERFGLPWELLAAIDQVKVERNLIAQYSNSDDVVKQAARLAPGTGKSRLKDIIKGLGYTEELNQQILERAELLQTHSILLSGAYSFPYKKSYYFQDTWGAEREGGKRRHEGTDIFAPEGVPIYSVSDGKVEKLGWNRLGGERVGIRGPDTIYYYYAHMVKINAKLQVGEEIARGTLLGFTGHTGDAIFTPDHLHFGMETAEGKWINPYNLLRYWEKNPK